MRSVRKSLLPWKSNKCYIFVCVCVRARVHACAWVGARARGRVCACSLAYAACNAYVPYCAICVLSGSTTHFEIISQTARFSEKLLIIKCAF